MNEIREMRRENLREAKKEEKEYVREVKKEESKGLNEVGEALEAIRSEAKSFIHLKFKNIEAWKKQIARYPVKNEMTHQLEAYIDLATHQIHQLEHLKSDLRSIWELLKSGPLSAEVYDSYKKELGNALTLLKRSKADFKHFGEVYSRIAWVHNTIPGAILVEHNIEKKRMAQIESRAHM